MKEKKGNLSQKNSCVDQNNADQSQPKRVCRQMRSSASNPIEEDSKMSPDVIYVSSSGPSSSQIRSKTLRDSMINATTNADKPRTSLVSNASKMKKTVISLDRNELKTYSLRRTDVSASKISQKINMTNNLISVHKSGHLLIPLNVTLPTSRITQNQNQTENPIASISNDANNVNAVKQISCITLCPTSSKKSDLAKTIKKIDNIKVIPISASVSCVPIQVSTSNSLPSTSFDSTNFLKCLPETHLKKYQYLQCKEALPYVENVLNDELKDKTDEEVKEMLQNLMEKFLGSQNLRENCANEGEKIRNIYRSIKMVSVSFVYF